MREAVCIRYVGVVINTNNGQVIPRFESVEPADRPSINTLEGWNSVADRGNYRAFVAAHDREPVDQDELNCWLEELCS